MNILFIYHDYFERRKKYGYILNELGHDVRFCNVGNKTKGKVVSTKMLEGIDFVLAINVAYRYFGSLNDNFIDRMKQKNIKLASYSTVLCEKTIPEMVEIAKDHDYVFEHTPEVVDMFKEHDKDNADKYIWLPHGFHPEQFYSKPQKKIYDISFGGHKQIRHGKRCDCLSELKRHYNITVFNAGLCKRMGVKVRKYNTAKEERTIYNKTKLCINLPYYDSTMPHLRWIAAPNDRFFEVPACGALQLTEHGDYLVKMFEPDKECFYFKDIPDMVKKAGWILKNEGDLDCVRSAARERALDEHTYKHRLKKLLEVVGV